MIIRGWHIDGFGIFHDWRSAELNAGLTVIQGPNEAGKSTLLAFIRGVLFGFPDKRSKNREPMYEPVSGGRPGGRLLLEHEGCRYTLERRTGGRNAATLTDEAGGELPDGELVRLLGGADKTLFRNVFGFSLSELQEQGSLTEESVRDRIFSGAIAGAGRSARKAADELERAATELYRPDSRSKKNKVAGLYDELRGVDEELRSARQAARAYPQKVEAERASAEALQQVRAELSDLQNRKHRLAALLKLWPEWCKRDEAVHRLQQEYGRRLDRTAEIEPDSDLADLQRQADQLSRSVELQQRRLEQASELRSTLNEQTRRIEQTVTELGTDWTAERVENFTLPIPTREEVRAWQDALEAPDADVRKAEERLAEADRRVNESRQRYEALARELEAFETPPAPLEQLQTRQAALDSLRGCLAEVAQARQAADHGRTLLEERGKRLDDLRAQQPGALGYGIALLLALATGSAAAFVAGALPPASDLGLPSVGGVPTLPLASGLFGILVAAAIAWSTHRRRSAAGSRIAQAEADRAQAEGDVAAQEEARDRLLEKAADAARELGLEELPGEAELVTLAGQLRHDMERRRQVDAKAREVRDATSELERRQKERQQTAEALQTAQQKHAEKQDAWDAWKVECAFPASLTPQGVWDFAEKVRAAQTTLQEKHRTEAALSDLRQAIAAWENAAQQVLRLRRDDAELEGEALVIAFNQAAAAIADEQDCYLRIRTVEEAVLRESGQDQNHADALRRTLTAGTAESWEQEWTEVEAALSRQEQAYEEAVRAHQTAERERAEVERSDRIAELEVQRNGLIGEIEQLYRQWQVYSAARTLIEETLERFERERQPAVFARASARLERVTGGRYRRIVQEAGGEGFSVLDGDGRRVAPLDLSRGTREQLYLAVRLGLIEEFVQRGTSLPLVMDEILVNFDPERMAAVAAELGAFAQEHQILLFTCHPEIAERVREHAGAAIVSMDEA